jgi:hypothetical protein
MMAAMMLPGAAPAVLRRARSGGGVRAVPLFIGSYLAVWALPGAAVYALYRPHGPVAAAVAVLAAGVYEVTPLKRHFRRRCRGSVRSGFGFGLCCAGSSIGLMAMLVALGAMSVTWMSVIAVLVLGQKLLPPRAAVDVPVALAIVGLGVGRDRFAAAGLHGDPRLRPGDQGRGHELLPPQGRSRDRHLDALRRRRHDAATRRHPGLTPGSAPRRAGTGGGERDRRPYHVRSAQRATGGAGLRDEGARLI